MRLSVVLGIFFHGVKKINKKKKSQINYYYKNLEQKNPVFTGVAGKDLNGISMGNMNLI